MNRRTQEAHKHQGAVKLAKRKCGMGLVMAKLEETDAHVVAMSILVLNLREILYAFIELLDWLLDILGPAQKRAVIRH